jgi:hypothetical protein
VVLDIKIGTKYSAKADITIASIRFNLVIKLDIYSELIKKACILLKI